MFYEKDAVWLNWLTIAK